MKCNLNSKETQGEDVFFITVFKYTINVSNRYKLDYPGFCMSLKQDKIMLKTRLYGAQMGFFWFYIIIFI